MIKAIVTDVDGVLIGRKENGFFPNPSPAIIQAVSEISKNIPVILCSGKPSFGLMPLIKLMDLHNIHIAANGAVIFNPDTAEYIVEPIDSTAAKTVIQTLEDNNINTDFVSDKTFIHPQNNVTSFMQKLAEARFIQPILVQNLINAMDIYPVIRIDVFIKPEEKQKVEALLQSYQSLIELHWTTVPFDSMSLGLITKKGLSKSTAFQKVVQKLQMDTSDILGIGDGFNDWDFMQHCGHIGIMGNAEIELITVSKTFENRIIGGDVDKDGILNIFRSYKLIL
ncbi:MAG: HAD family hydrolase [Candidatus Gottesmanbacteria bacterium]